MARTRNDTYDSVNPYITFSDILFNLVLIFLLTTVFISILNTIGQEQVKESGEIIQGLDDNVSTLKQQIIVLLGDKEDLENELDLLSDKLNKKTSENETLANKLIVLQKDLDIQGDANQNLEDAEKLVDQLVLEIGRLQSEVGNKDKDIEQLNNKIISIQRSNFIVITVQWETKHDIDLVVIDPEENVFYWDMKKYTNSDALITLDNIAGGDSDTPAVEAWIEREAKANSLYQVYIGIYQCGNTLCENTRANVTIHNRDNEVQVEVPIDSSKLYETVYKRNGAPISETQKIKKVKESLPFFYKVADLIVDNNGFIDVKQ